MCEDKLCVGKLCVRRLATQSGGRCHQVPRLPRQVKVAVTKCHACHANSRGARQTQAPPEPAQCRKYHACHVAKGHACHAK